MRVYTPNVKEIVPIRNNGHDLALRKWGWGVALQISIDNLLVALLIALGPEPDQGAANDRVLDSLLSIDQRNTRQTRFNGLADDPSACRYFADAEARRKCMIRTSRIAQSGAAEPAGSYPETLIWLAPTEPR
ncbi:MAG TPA: hypothetical protein VHM01_05930, partial [Alphaproteobacteria bacterium]|nr:hypothetical protein [Alphaproteobacteria bacterium]